MPEEIAGSTASQQVELAILQLDSLSTLPSVAATFLPQFLQSHFSPSDLDEIIESDPALTAKILTLISQQALDSSAKLSIRQMLDKLPAHLVRDALLSIRVAGIFDADYSPENYRFSPRKQLALHNLAVACCAKNIAEITSPQINAQLAYSAGLLHDIGKLALDQAMPKSFSRILEEAKSQNASTCTIEQKYLGLDHTILGKRLAQKWHLPDQITLAIWLHHSDTTAIAQTMPEARIAQIVQLADTIARQCSIGQSGSYDVPDLPDAIVKSLAINSEQLQKIRRNLPDQVMQKSKLLGLESPAAAAAYGDAVQTAIRQLARDNTKLSLEERQLQTDAGHFNFTIDFLTSIGSTASPIDIAENFAVRWQKFYQTGMVCLYLAPPANPQKLQAVIVENLSQSRMVYLNAPADSPPIPEAIISKFAILDAHDCIDWLFEQLDVDFDSNHTKLAPLLSNGKAIGAIAFELRYPGDTELFYEKLRTTTSVAGAVLDAALASADRQRFAEQLVALLGQLRTAQQQLASTSSLNALAEMAAGAAHELNNPLSVISGRAQLLAKTETDAEKKQILKQIQENASEISQIIDALMSFAKPPQPRPTSTSIKQILAEAAQLTAQKQNIEQIDVQTNIAEACKNVFVDSAQIASAIANIFSNSLESYPSGRGPIKFTAGPHETGDLVKVVISDLGCGMDAETLQKATQPFFSAKPAGRKRGMGLAHTQRTIQSNGGSLNITSQPGSGTTVTILLPCK